MSHGYKVVRFWNDEVLKHIDSVLEVIMAALAECVFPPLSASFSSSSHIPLTPTMSPSPQPSPHGGEGVRGSGEGEKIIFQGRLDKEK